MTARRNGFSLTELMATLLISLVVFGGVMVAFRKINEAARDASRGTDTTLANRGLFIQLENDFSNAGLGFADLQAYNIRYNFSDAFSPSGSNPPYFYGIADHQIDPDTGFHTVILHWFDYDLSGGTETKSPTFIFALSDETATTFPADALYLDANLIGQQAFVEGLEVGDILLVYKNEVRQSSTSYKDTEANDRPAVWNIDELSGGSAPKNTAIILEVTSVGSVEDGRDPFSTMKMATVRFDNPTDENIFSNDLESDGLKMDFTFPAQDTLQNNVNDGPLGNVFFARKMGNRSNFHRVRYAVDTSGQYPTLLRYHNADGPEVIATNISTFSIKMGFDIQPGTLPENVMRADMDGMVSIQDPDVWAEGFNDFLVSYDDYLVLLGRHGMAAEVKVTTSSLMKQAQTGEEVKRSFQQRFRINNAIPTPFF